MEDAAAPEAPPAPKRKRSRKAQIKELAKRKCERCDPDFQPEVDGDAAEDAEDGAELPDLPVEQPGDAAKWAEGAYQKRRQRLRGLGSEALTPSISCMRHLCLFLPKFHCELNWIERMWAALKHGSAGHVP